MSSRERYEEMEFKGKKLLGKFLANLRANMLAPATIRKYRVFLGLALRYFEKDIETLTSEDIEQWKYEMAVNRKYEPESVARNIRMLKKFLRYLGREKVAENVEIPKRPSTILPEKEIWLSSWEETAIVEKSKQLGKRKYAIIKLFLSTGMRAGELRKLDAPDIDFKQRLVRIKYGKGGKGRTVPMDTETKEALLQYLKERTEPSDGSKALFTSQCGTRLSYPIVWKIVNECAVLAGIDKHISPHKLRHTFLTRVIETTKDIPLAQKLAGHSKIKTTMRYHHTTEEEVIEKYRRFFDTPKAKQQPKPQMSKEEMSRALDVKFINGELPYNTYIELKKRYQSEEKAKRTERKREEDIAYV